MLLLKEKKVDVVFINPNLTHEGEGLGIADEIILKFNCEIFIFSKYLEPRLKERFRAVSAHKFIDESLRSEVNEALFGVFDDQLKI